MNKSRNNNKKIKLPLRRILSDNIFMLKILHKSSPFLVSVTLMVALIGAFSEFISNTFLLRYALNGINKGKTFREIAMILIFWLFFRVIVSGISAFYKNCYYNVKITDVKKDIHHIIYKKATSVELGCYENPQYYDDFVKAIEECGTRAEAVINSLVDLIYRIIGFSTNFILVILIDPILLLFVVIPILTIPIQSKLNKVKYNKTMEIKEENRRKDYARRTFYLADYAKEMRLSNMPGLMLKQFKESGERVVALIKKYGFSLAVLGYIITECNEMLTTLGTTMYAVWQTLGTGRMGYGDCIVIVNSIDSIAYTLTDSANILLKFQENALYIENLRKFLDYAPQIEDGKKEIPTDGDIVFDNVSFKYDGSDKNVLTNISIRFGKNEKIAIVGHNGAGKSTLVKLLLRLYDCEGTITYGGTNIKDFKLEQYRKIFSAVMQDFHIFALSIAENVLLRRRVAEDDKLIVKALQKSGLEDKVNSFENGIETIMTKEFDDKGELLSGGEQQKLAISHVYSKDNKFIILDEPSSALDPIAEYEMYNNMMIACQNCGMIFISHRLSSAVMADRIYLMEKGEVVETGTHEELMKNNGKYAEMFRKQAQNYAEVK